MSVRLYWTPIVGDGLTVATAFRVEIPGARCRAPIPVHPRYTAEGDINALAGTPRLTHTIAVASADDWKAVGAEHRQLLPDVDAKVPRELLAPTLQWTLGDLDEAQRTAWQDVLAALELKADDIAPELPVSKLLQRVLVHLDPQGAHVEGLLA
jgi:hypothetical protein